MTTTNPPTTTTTTTTPLNEQAESFKNQGNDFFKQKQYEKAIELYTKAIEIPPTSLYYCNRALNHIHLENYGSALSDANQAIQLDVSNPKAYYRRGTSYLALSKFSEALADFQKVVQLHPQDKVARTKVALCKQEIRSIQFLKAIESEDQSPLSQTVDWRSIAINSDYDGMRIDALE